MLYKDKKETISFLGELISYAYIFSAFFSSKLNMKVGYLLLIVSFLYICINKDIIKLVNKKIYGMFLLILILGCFWNYISAGMIGMSKFININTKFFYGIAMFPFLVNIKKDKFNILIFLITNLLSIIFLYNESYLYTLLDDLGRIRAILLIAWIYVLVYSFEKISENFKKYIFLLLASVYPFIALGRSGSRMGALALFITIFLYIIFKIFKDKKNIKFVSIVLAILFFTGVFLPKEYTERLKTSFQTSQNISNEDRIVMWKAGKHIFKENLIFGIGTYKKNIYPHVKKYVDENIQDEQLRQEFLNEDRFAMLHNMYVDFFVQNGILGFLYLILFFILIPFIFFKYNKNNESISAFFTLIFYLFYGFTWSLWASLPISQVLFQIFLIWMLVNLKKE